MSRCPRTAQLEPAVLGELPDAVHADLVRHAEGCAVCRHELRWLESERSLLRQRAAHAEVERLWEGTLGRTPAKATRRSLGTLAGLAAALAMAVALPRALVDVRSPWGARGDAGAGFLEGPALMTEAIESPAGAPPREGPQACSILPSGIGFHCAAPVPASFGTLWVQR